jgi:hypothetical protein
MDEQFDDELELEDEDDDSEEGYEVYTPETPLVLDGSEVNVDQAMYAALIHDSFGERHINVAKLRERGGAVSVLRVLGAMKLEPKGEIQIHVNGNRGTLDSVVNPGDQVYIVGKLAGGR